MEYKAIAEKIIGLKNADLELRQRLIKSGQLGLGYNEEMEKLHSNNAKTLNEIIDSIGYPTIEKVGEEATQATWLVIQHAIGHPDFMKKCVALLEKLDNHSNATKRNLAYLTDRIAIFEGRSQLYGTQFDWDKKGALSPQSIDDLVKVNQRRKSIGLNTLQEQTTIIRTQAKNDNQSPPLDFKKRNEAYEKWRRAVGWTNREQTGGTNA